MLVGVVKMGVKVGRGVEVAVGVGDTYQRGVDGGVRVGGKTGGGVIIDSGGYKSNMAVCQSNPPGMTNSLNRAAGKDALQVMRAGKRSHP